ncbi:hypothetical protein Tco_0462301 [Tanacetum coccineum]
MDPIPPILLFHSVHLAQVEVEAAKTEYGNARLKCIAADECAKLLAYEVIGLEEKALRLRSSELKLERQIGYLEAEISSQKYGSSSSLDRLSDDLGTKVGTPSGV